MKKSKGESKFSL